MWERVWKWKTVKLFAGSSYGCITPLNNFILFPSNPRVITTRIKYIPLITIAFENINDELVWYTINTNRKLFVLPTRPIQYRFPRLEYDFFFVFDKLVPILLEAIIFLHDRCLLKFHANLTQLLDLLFSISLHFNIFKIDSFSIFYLLAVFLRIMPLIKVPWFVNTFLILLKALNLRGQSLYLHPNLLYLLIFPLNFGVFIFYLSLYLALWSRAGGHADFELYHFYYPN